MSGSSCKGDQRMREANAKRAEGAAPLRAARRSKDLGTTTLEIRAERAGATIADNPGRACESYFGILHNCEKGRTCKAAAAAATKTCAGDELRRQPAADRAPWQTHEKRGSGNY